MDSIKKSSDFKLISRLGKKWVSKSFVMLVLKHKDPKSSSRLGLTVSRKVGNAVVRNKVKRRFREIFKLCSESCNISGLDIVLIGRYSSPKREFSLIKDDFIWCLKKLELV